MFGVILHKPRCIRTGYFDNNGLVPGEGFLGQRERLIRGASCSTGMAQPPLKESPLPGGAPLQSGSYRSGREEGVSGGGHQP